MNTHRCLIILSLALTGCGAYQKRLDLGNPQNMYSGPRPLNQTGVVFLRNIVGQSFRKIDDKECFDEEFHNLCNGSIRLLAGKHTFHVNFDYKGWRLYNANSIEIEGDIEARHTYVIDYQLDVSVSPNIISMRLVDLGENATATIRVSGNIFSKLEPFTPKFD
jgi:hypothetical protein